MKGTITIKAIEVGEKETRLGVYADIQCVGVEDKIRIVHGIMDALEFTRSEKKLLALALAVDATDMGAKAQQCIRGENAGKEYEKFFGGHE